MLYKLNDSFYNNELLTTNCKENYYTLLIDYQKVKDYYKFDDLNLLKFLYYNKNIIHYELYYEEKYIRLNIDDRPKNLSYYFYLCLLINYNCDIINYKYSLDYIKYIIYNYQKYEKEYCLYKKIITFKIILELLYNYEGFVENDSDSNDIEAIKEESIKIIKNNIYLYNKLNLNWKLEDIMSKNVEELYIDIINAIISTKHFIEDEYENIYNIIMQLELEYIDITKKMFENIKKLLDTDNNNYVDNYLLSNIKDLHNMEKINFYYILLKYILKSPIFIYQIEYLLKTRKNILNIIRTNNNIYAYSNIYKNNKNMEKRLDYVLEIIIDSKYYMYKLKKQSLFFSKFFEQNSNLSSESNGKEVIQISDNKNNNSNNNILKNISSYEIKVIDNSEMIKSKNSKILNNIVLSEKENKKIFDSNISSIIKKSSISKINILSYTENSFLNKFYEQYEFLKFIKIVDQVENYTKRPLDVIAETKNYLIIGEGINLLNVYDKYDNFYKKKYLTYNVEDWINNIIIDDDNLIVCTNNKIISLSLGNECNIRDNNLLYNKENATFLIKENNKYFLLTENGLFINTVSPIIQNKNKIINEFFLKSGIKINNHLFACKSNRIISKGKDELLFYNSIKRWTFKIKDFSFILSNNGMMVMQIGKEIKNKNQVLFCACKKYIRNQKNGILLVNIDSEHNLNYTFYDTYNFEVFCFCQLFKETFSILIDKKEATDYFLVGGFDKKKRKGIIKLYKIINKKNNQYKTKIKFIENIYDNCNFKGPISCIIQSKFDSKISVICWDGNIYLFDKPNINYYLERDKQFKKNISINKFFPKH